MSWKLKGLNPSKNFGALKNCVKISVKDLYIYYIALEFSFSFEMLIWLQCLVFPMAKYLDQINIFP